MAKRSRTRGIMRRCLSAMLVLLMLPAQVAFSSESGRVAYVVNPKPEDRLRLRQEASTGSAALGRYYTGTVVEVLENQGDFSRVRIGPNTGYMHNSFLSDYRVKLVLGTWASVYIWDATNRLLHLRTEPRNNASSLGMYGNGTVVQILGEDGDYYKVRAFDLDGYMHKDYLLVDVTWNGAAVPGTLRANTHLRAFPSTDAASLGVFQESSVKIYGKAGDWYYVEIESMSPLENQCGFAHADYVTLR